MSTVLVLGGGVTGLSTAYYLSKLVSSQIKRVILVESASRLGGWVDTSRYDDGTIFEHGPRSLRGAGASGYNSLMLAEELGLSDQVINVKRSHPAAKNRFVYVNKQLCVLPNGLGSLFKKQAPFSKPLALQGWKEPFTKADIKDDDSVFNFFKRRFGVEVAMYAADPLCRGIFAGDCRQLSMRSCFPAVYDMEQKYGSVIMGAIRAPKAKDLPQCDLIERYKQENWAIWSLRNGLEELPQALIAKLESADNVDIMTETQCSRMVTEDGKVKVYFGPKEEVVTADHVFATCPAQSLSPLLSAQHAPLSADLASISSADVAVVNLQYRGNQLPVQGFGHLIPSTEPSQVLGVLYESSVFTEHNDSDQATTRITCMMGGAWFREYFGDPDSCNLDALNEIAIRTVNEHLGIKDDPFRAIIKLQRDCIPQYVLGHHQTLSSVDAYVGVHALPLSLLGASYRGVSVNDCMYNARVEVERWAGEER